MQFMEGQMVSDALIAIDAGKLKAEIEEVSFYKNGTPIIVDMDERFQFVAVGSGELKERRWFCIEGKRENIIEVNKLAGLELTPANVLSYLAFYFRVQEHGPELAHPRADIPGSFEPYVERVTEDGGFICCATMFYSDAAYDMRFELSPQGDVGVVEERLLATPPDVP
jgi:hypothetical protein